MLDLCIWPTLYEMSPINKVALSCLDLRESENELNAVSSVLCKLCISLSIELNICFKISILWTLQKLDASSQGAFHRRKPQTSTFFGGHMLHDDTKSTPEGSSSIINVRALFVTMQYDPLLHCSLIMINICITCESLPVPLSSSMMDIKNYFNMMWSQNSFYF